MNIQGNDAKHRYQLLLQQRKEIEASIGATLKWQKLPNRKNSKIGLYNDRCNPNNEENWPIQHEWFISTLEKFDKTFRSQIKSLKINDWYASIEQAVATDFV